MNASTLSQSGVLTSLVRWATGRQSDDREAFGKRSAASKPRHVSLPAPLSEISNIPARRAVSGSFARLGEALWQTASKVETARPHKPKHARKKSDPYDYVIGVVGAAGCGKSSLIRRGLGSCGLVEHPMLLTLGPEGAAGRMDFVAATTPDHATFVSSELGVTIDASLRSARVLVVETSLLNRDTLRLWPIGVPHMDGVVLCYDASDAASFDAIPSLLRDFRAFGLTTVLVACKTDLPVRVQPLLAEQYVQDHGIGVVETSTATDWGRRKMRDMFNWLLIDIAREKALPFAIHRDLTAELSHMTVRPCKFGGLSDVYRADWKSPIGTMMVAVKCLRPHSRHQAKMLQVDIIQLRSYAVRMNQAVISRLQRLRREIYVWQHLRHPNVLPLYGVYQNMGVLPCLVSPWCENGDICTYLASKRNMPSSEFFALQLEMLEQVLHGLLYLHTYMPVIIHGDIKGANILVSDLQVVQLCDFGFASMLSHGDLSMVQSSSVKGSWRWMSPELVADEDASYSTKSDIWAYGCVLLEVLSGIMPFYDKRSDQSVIMAVAQGSHPSPPPGCLIPTDLWNLMNTCWCPEPQDRPPVEEVLAGLQRCRVN